MSNHIPSATKVSRREALGMGAAASVASLALADGAFASAGAARRQGLQALGYVVAPAPNLEAWDKWAPRVFGLQLADQSATTRVFRMDDHEYRLALDQMAQTPTLGWEVADAAALDAMAARIEAAGVKVERGSRALVGQRGVRDLVTLTDPAGNGVEIFHGAALAKTPFQPARPIAGFKTGPLGLGHAPISVQPALFEKTTAFYRGVLGFLLSDYFMINGSRAGEFLHINPREHSFGVAVSRNNKNEFSHIMMEMQFLDDVGHSYDIAFKDYRTSLVSTIGRHTNDLMTSYYIQTPSGFMMECGWGGLLIDSERWQARELASGFSIWGHQMMKDGQPLEGVQMPPWAERPLRAPLQMSGSGFDVDHHPTELAQVLKTERAS